MTIDEIREKWDYPNADKLDWNEAKDTVDFLLSQYDKLKEKIKELKKGSSI